MRRQCPSPPPLRYRRALWHCYTTATTNGYGDVRLNTQSSQLFACLHILLSVSWLASLLGRAQATRTHRRFELQRARALRIQLSTDLIAALETDTARKEQRGVNELEFVLGMLIGLGAEICGEPLDFKKHVTPLLARFRHLDDDCSGYLTRDDIRFMVAEAAKQAGMESDLEESSSSDGASRPSVSKLVSNSSRTTQQL